jgi:hypothetical protein
MFTHTKYERIDIYNGQLDFAWAIGGGGSKNTAVGLTVGTGWLAYSSCCCSSSASSSSPWMAAGREAKLVYNNVFSVNIIHFSKLNTHI